MDSKKIVVGLVGEKGSGKETFTQLLGEIAPDLKILRIRFSDVLNETLKLWGIPQTRSNLQVLAVIMKNQFGPILSHAVYQRILVNSAQIIILDGVRWQPDVELIRDFPHSFLVYVTAPIKLRYERIRSRTEKQGEFNMSFEQFMKEETTENELLIPKIGMGADFKVSNNGTMEHFKMQVGRFCTKLLKTA